MEQRKNGQMTESKPFGFFRGPIVVNRLLFRVGDSPLVDDNIRPGAKRSKKERSEKRWER
jgi:hypothetical protein